VLTFAVLATACSGLFAGAAIYVSAVESPPLLSGGPELEAKGFATRYERAMILQGSLALIGSATGLIAAWQAKDSQLLVGGLLLAAAVAITLVVLRPADKRLRNPTLDAERALVRRARWGRLHLVRSVLGFLAFFAFLLWLAV
jgi:hypothetical protein